MSDNKPTPMLQGVMDRPLCGIHEGPASVKIEGNPDTFSVRINDYFVRALWTPAGIVYRQMYVPEITIRQQTGEL